MELKTRLETELKRLKNELLEAIETNDRELEGRLLKRINVIEFMLEGDTLNELKPKGQEFVLEQGKTYLFKDGKIEEYKPFNLFEFFKKYRHEISFFLLGLSTAFLIFK